MPLSPNQVYLVVSSIVDTFHTARTQLAVLKQFRRRRARKSSNPTIAARDRTTLRKEPIKRSDEPVYSPPHTVWEARGRPSTCQRPCKRIELIRSDKATTSASLGHSWSMTPFQGFGTDCPKISVSLKCSSSVDLPSVFCCADIVQPYSLPVLKEGDLDPGSASPEFFPLQREVQDADTESYSGSDSCRRVVHHCRPEGCLFSYSGCSATQEAHRVRLWGKGVPISGSPFWSGFGSTNIHKVYCVSGPAEAPGRPCAQQPGWLTHPDPI